MGSVTILALARLARPNLVLTVFRHYLSLDQPIPKISPTGHDTELQYLNKWTTRSVNILRDNLRENLHEHLHENLREHLRENLREHLRENLHENLRENRVKNMSQMPQANMCEKA